MVNANIKEDTYIYFLYDTSWTSNSFYIGKTKNPEQRFEEHLSLKELKENNKKANWINDLLNRGSSIGMYIICKVPDYMTWKEAESQWIGFIEWCGVSLKNSRIPGEGPMSITNEVKEKISKSLTGRKKGPHKQITKNKQSISARILRKCVNKTGFKGVYFIKSRNKFRADIIIHNKNYELGQYKTAIEAATAYDKALRFIFGTTARFNFPLTGELSARENIDGQHWDNLPNVKFKMPNILVKLEVI